MAHRMAGKSFKGRFFFIFIAVFVIISLVYYYWANAEISYKHTKLAEKRCLSELSFAKYELDVVTEYKTHVETMLADCLKEHNTDKDKFKEVAENCNTMKQQWSLCQNQFDDLQNECKKARQNVNKEQYEIDYLKKILEEEQLKSKEAKKYIAKLMEQITNLKNINKRLRLQSNVNSQQSFNNYKPENPLSFSKMVEVSPGEYNVLVNNKTNPSGINVLPVSQVVANPPGEYNNVPQIKPQITPEKKMETSKAVQDKDNLSNNLPPGFAPFLPVLESIKPQLPQVSSNFAPEKTKKKIDENRANDKDLEIMENVHDPMLNDVGMDKEGLHAPLENKPNENFDKMNDANSNNENDVNNAQEDDDEGEEYAAN